VTTDANGRFRVLGLDPDMPVTFEVEDPRFARQVFSFHTRTPGSGQYARQPSTTFTLLPAQVFDIHITHADDGQPIAGAQVDVENEAVPIRREPPIITTARTDRQGRVQIIGGPSTSYRIHVFPPEGEPYVPVWHRMTWPKASVRQSVELKLQRGAIVRGRLTEEPAGVPVAGAWIVYLQPRRDNARYLRLPTMETVSGPDGTFTMVVPHGPGHLLVRGPSSDYLHVTTSRSAMGVGGLPNVHMYPDAHASLDIKDGEATHPVELRLRRGVTITGRVVGPDGKPVAEAYLFGRSYAPFREVARFFAWSNGDPPRIEVKDGRFEIPGCDPDQPGTFHFLDLKDRLGTTVELSARSAAAGPVTVRLQPTASARILVKGRDGKPPTRLEARNQLADLRLIVTPGADFNQINANVPLMDSAYQMNINESYDSPPPTSPESRVTVINLIPGARYRFRGREFTPEPGQTIDLSDVPVERPSR
jgi:hypothetical protein